MFDRKQSRTTRANAKNRARPPRRRLQPGLENLEGRQLLASLAPIAPVSSPSGLGYQVPLQGGTTGEQTFEAQSSNPNVKVSVAEGNFWTIGVEHESSGAGDPAFNGSLTFQLFDDLTPLTVSRIEQLIESGFYTSPTDSASAGGAGLSTKNFHRIVDGFVAQGGSKSGNGTGKLDAPGYPFADEFVQQLVFNGEAQLAMANAGDNTNDTQFFVTFGPTRNLDYNHTIFGQLVSGSETLAQMQQVATEAGPGGEKSVPVKPILITSSTLSSTNPNGVLHVDTTGAAIGETANVTVTATDPSDNTTVTQTFQVNVTPNLDANGQPINQPPFLNPLPNFTVAKDQTAVFLATATNPEPDDTLTFVVNGGTVNGAFVPVQNATASVDADGVVTVKPDPGFTGTIELQVGVRDQVIHPGRSTSLDEPSNFDTRTITLTVRDGAPVNLQPIAAPGRATVSVGQPSTVQLTGLTANPDSPSQTLTYTLLEGPQHGSLTDFDPAKGTFTYTPGPDFLGTDSVRFQVTDSGEPTPNLISSPATFTIEVAGAHTGAVRVLQRVLIVTPPPRTDHGTNTIHVETINNGANYQVRLNGMIDTLMPSVMDIDRIVVYGSRANDRISVAPDVLVPATLDGGRKGINSLRAGGGPSRLHGWFGHNLLAGGPSDDALIGRQGAVRFLPSGGRDLIFAGRGFGARRHGSHTSPLFDTTAIPNRPPTGTFYRFAGDRLVPLQTPPLHVFKVEHPNVGGGPDHQSRAGQRILLTQPPAQGLPRDLTPGDRPQTPRRLGQS